MTPAVRALEQAGVAFTIHTIDSAQGRSDAGYGEQAVEALGVVGERVLKTLVADVDGRLVVAVVPVPSRLDLKALAAAVGGKKATMAEPASAERSTGYVVGGISPFGQRKPLTTVLDESSIAFDTVFVSAGRRGVELEVSPTGLLQVVSGHTARIGR